MKNLAIIMRQSISLAILATASAAAPVHWGHPSPISLFTFGDSYSMTSFNVSLTQPSASDPMGNPALGQGTTTGGINWIGYLTTEYNRTLVLSYNLAVGGATIDNNIVANPGYPDDIVYQVGLFKTNYADHPSYARWKASDTVFGFWIGVNDAGNSFWNSNPKNITSVLAKRYEQLVEEIYQAGGRKFLFLNVPPISRTPFWISQGSTAVQEMTAYLPIFNEAIADMVWNFQLKYHDSTVVLYDTFPLMTAILNSPTKYGYPNDTAASCYNSDGTTCVWWNTLHPGRRFHQLMAADMAPRLWPLGW